MRPPKKPRHETARNVPRAEERRAPDHLGHESPEHLDHEWDESDDEWDLEELEAEARGSSMSGARERLGALLSASKKAGKSATEKIAERRRSSSQPFSLSERRAEKVRERRKTWLKRSLIGLVIAAILAGLVWLFFFSSTFVVEKEQMTVDVTDSAGVISGDDVYPILDPVVGTPTLRVDEGGLAAKLEQLPEVASASVSRSWPHGLHVELVATEPIACLVRGESCVPITGEGVELARITPDALEHLPRIDMSLESDGGQKRLGDLVAALDALPAGVRDQLDTATISDTGLIEFTVGNKVVKWGTSTDNETKAGVLEILLDQPATIVDVSVPTAPVTR